MKIGSWYTEGINTVKWICSLPVSSRMCSPLQGCPCLSGWKNKCCRINDNFLTSASIIQLDCTCMESFSAPLRRETECFCTKSTPMTPCLKLCYCCDSWVLWTQRDITCWSKAALWTAQPKSIWWVVEGRQRSIQHWERGTSRGQVW